MFVSSTKSSVPASLGALKSLYFWWYFANQGTCFGHSTIAVCHIEIADVCTCANTHLVVVLRVLGCRYDGYIQTGMYLDYAGVLNMCKSMSEKSVHPTVPINGKKSYFGSETKQSFEHVIYWK